MGQTSELESAVYLLLVGIIGMLVLAMAIILFFLIYQKRLSAQQEKIVALKIEHQKDLLQAILRAQESERKRIANDLHDSIGSTLSAVKLFFNQLNPNTDQQTYSQLKQQIKVSLDDTITNIRIITQNLLPTSLEKYGLIAATEDLCHQLNQLSKINLKFNYNRNERFNHDIEITTYRVIQELINNTLKHAEANTIKIEFNIEHKHLELIYLDDGHGFEINNSLLLKNNHKGFGLKSIESRLN
ncbi:MAG: histidine kinase [Bacteroidota bacterium]